ncbi:hypothetical protein OAI23_05645 [Alphaproteobacteria bacterium]|nr:hypothetical protein [Alphaproteobacteria bacterium]
MTRRTTLFLVCAFEVVLILFFVAWSALAETQDKNSWFIEGRYQASLYEGNGWKENEVDLGGASSNIITATSEKRDKLNSSGIAVGRTFLENKVGLSLTYEKFASSTWSSGNFVSQDGRTFDYARYPMRMHHFMLETSYSHPINETLSFISLIGLGQAHIRTDGLAKAVSGAELSGITQEKRVTNLSKRVGTGLQKNISRNLDVIGLLQYSDYGYAETYCCVTGTETFETEVTAVEASIRLRYHF